MQQDIFKADSLACGFFAELFQAEPQGAMLKTIRDEQLFDAWPVPPTTPGGEEGLGLLKRFFAAYDRHKHQAVARDFSRMFIGPGDPLPQWESVCTTEERLLFGEPTLAVRKAYAEFGFESPNRDHEPGDQIGYELAFVASLLDLAASSLEQGDAGEAARFAQGARRFMDEHLLVWSEEFLSALEKRAETDLYKGAAQLCRDTLTAVRANLAGDLAG